MTPCETRRRWKRVYGLLRWICEDLPDWCVTCSFVPDRHGVYRRQFFAQYRGVRIGEASVSSAPEPVIDALDELLGRTYRSPRYIRHQRSTETE